MKIYSVMFLIIFAAIIFSSCTSVPITTPFYDSTFFFDAQKYESQMAGNRIRQLHCSCTGCRIKEIVNDSILISEVYTNYCVKPCKRDPNSFLNNKLFDGESKYWYETGILKKKINHRSYLNKDYDKEKFEFGCYESFKNGLLQTYYPDSTVRRTEHYTKGVLDWGYCFDENCNEIPHFPYEIEVAYDSTLFITRTLSTADPMDLENIEYLSVEIYIDALGNPMYMAYNSEIECKLLDLIAKQVEITRFYPAMDDGEPIPSSVQVEISFD
jgi:hypothetical protein